MKLHILKIKDKDFQYLIRGRKSFELRKNLYYSLCFKRCA